jgi:nitrogen fixation NifU-like protein
MSDLKELYQDLIIDHGRHPRNFGACAHANHVKEGFNPLCGDKVTLYVNTQQGIIENISFEGSGCAISMASASLMTEAVKGKSIEMAQELFDGFHQLVTKAQPNEKLGKLAALAGVAEYPMRVKCATLAWHTLAAALNIQLS